MKTMSKFLAAVVLCVCPFVQANAQSANLQRVRDFYLAFQSVLPGEMGKYYAPNAKFSDPMFGELDALETAIMWQMILKGGTATINLKAQEPSEITNSTVRIEWTAIYDSPVPGVPAGFLVINKVVTEITLENGLILTQKDTFDSCAWAKMAIPNVTDTTCGPAFAQVSAGFRAALSKQVQCVKATGAACP